MKSSLSIFLLQTLLLSANLVCLDFLLCLFYKFYILSPPSIWSHFCIRTSVKNIYIYIYIFFACGSYGCPIPPTPFVEKVIFLHYFGFFVKNQLSIFMLLYFWFLCSVPLICVSVPPPVPPSFDYCSYIMSFSIG